MKNSNMLFILIALTSILQGLPHHTQAQILAGDTWANAKQNKRGTIVLSYIYTPGLAFKNQYGELDGVCFDIVKEFIAFVQRETGVALKAKVRPQSQNFDSFMRGVKTAQGGVFGLGNITITVAREREYDFTEPFINNLAFMITHTSIPTLSALSNMANQFRGMQAYTVKGSTNEKYILELKNKYYPQLPIYYVPNSREALKKVVNDPQAFTSLDFNYFAEAIKSNYPIKRHPVGDVNVEQFGIIMPNNNDWKPLWDAFFKSENFIRSISYRKILIKHLGISAVRALDSYR